MSAHAQLDAEDARIHIELSGLPAYESTESSSSDRSDVSSILVDPVAGEELAQTVSRLDIAIFIVGCRGADDIAKGRLAH